MLEAPELVTTSFALILSKEVVNYLESKSCGNCLAQETLKMHSTYPNLGGGETILYVCTNCTVIYNSALEISARANNQIQKEWLLTYDIYDIPSDIKEFEGLVQESSNIFQWFLENINYDFRNKSYLEIGAGTGIASVAATSYFEKCTATDLELERLNLAKSISKVENLDVIKIADIDHINFDFFFAWHVFEHLINPGEVIREAFRRLNSNGVMFIQVPLLTERHMFTEHIFIHNQYSWTTMLSGLQIKERYFYYDTALCALTLVVIKE